MYNVSVKKMSTHNPLIWGVFSILFGVLLIAWQGEFLHMLVRVLGIILLLAGVLQFFNFMRLTKGMENRWSMFPFATLLAVVLGLMFSISPVSWVNVFMILVGVIVFLLALASIVNLISVRKYTTIKWWYFVYPFLQLIASGLIVYQPSFLADFAVIFAGVWIIMYGVSEFIAYFMLKSKSK